jgi:bifunctional DNA-binding transcriptional regulator/antitoxin component of YhaV-PrlF toxin-antitoxin module
VGGKTFAVSLPVEVVKQLGWIKGDKLIVRRQSSSIVIQKKEQ